MNFRRTLLVHRTEARIDPEAVRSSARCVVSQARFGATLPSSIRAGGGAFGSRSSKRTREQEALSSPGSPPQLRPAGAACRVFAQPGLRTTKERRSDQLVERDTSRNMSPYSWAAIRRGLKVSMFLVIP